MADSALTSALTSAQDKYKTKPEQYRLWTGAREPEFNGDAAPFDLRVRARLERLAAGVDDDLNEEALGHVDRRKHLEHWFGGEDSFVLVAMRDRKNKAGEYVRNAKGKPHQEVESKRFTSIDKEVMDWCDEQQSGFNIYDQPQRIKSTYELGEGKRPKDNSVEALLGAVGDMDANPEIPDGASEDDVARLYATTRADQRRIIDYLINSSMPPSMVIDSGGGHQPRYRFIEPITAKDERKITAEANAQLAAVINGDSVNEPSRMMRTGGTVNVLNETKILRQREPAVTRVVHLGAPVDAEEFRREIHWLYLLRRRGSKDSKAGLIGLDTPMDVLEELDVAADDMQGYLSRVNFLPETLRTKFRNVLEGRKGAPLRYKLSGGREDLAGKKDTHSEHDHVFIWLLRVLGFDEKESRLIAACNLFGKVAEEGPAYFDVSWGKAGKDVEATFAATYSEKFAYYNSFCDHVRIAGVNYVIEYNDIETQQTIEQFRQSHAHDTVHFLDKDVPVVNIWLKSDKHNYHLGGVDIRPDHDRAFRDRHGQSVLNLWRHKPLPAYQGDWSYIRDGLLRDIICGGDMAAFEFEMAKLADMEQNPALLPGITTILYGPEGGGKGLYIDGFLQKLIGPDLYFAASQKEQLTGKFKDHLVGKLIAYGDEIDIANDKKALNELKHMTTQGRVPVEGKHKQTRTVTNFTRVYLSTNEIHAIEADINSRRWFVLRVQPLALVGSGDMAEREEYDRLFAPIIDQVENPDCIAAARWDLRRHDTGKYRQPGGAKFQLHMPITAGLDEQREESLNPIVEWLTDKVITGEVLNHSIAGRAAVVSYNHCVTDYALWLRNRFSASRTIPAGFEPTVTRMNKKIAQILGEAAKNQKTPGHEIKFGGDPYTSGVREAEGQVFRPDGWRFPDSETLLSMIRAATGLKLAHVEAASPSRVADEEINTAVSVLGKVGKEGEKVGEVENEGDTALEVDIEDLIG